MVINKLENWKQYADTGTRLERAFQFLVEEFDPNAPEGIIKVEGDAIFASVQGYKTKAPDLCKFETHRKYIDIQLILDGAEDIGWAPREGLVVSEEYDSKTDLMFYKCPDTYTLLNVLPGSFALFRPHDAHMPQMKAAGVDFVHKVVMKIQVED